MSPEPLRLFIAIELPEAARESLAVLQKRLQGFDSRRSVRWSSIDSIHLTLKFLSDTPPDRLAAINEALAAAVAGHAPFEVSIAGAGCFPDMRRPRVFWAGSGGDQAALHALRDAIERTVSPLGFPTEDRAFSPHFTLGRARQEADRKALAALGEQIGKLNAGLLYSWRAEGVSLMRSDLKPSGAVYTQMAYFALSAH